MRIIAGANRGMRLFSPKTSVSRPITDRVKESLFDILCNYDVPRDQVVADLFSGVGSVGLEALSRGARFVSFVEKDRQTCLTLERNISKAGFVKVSKVIRADAFEVGAPLAVTGTLYDFVMVDPPFAQSADSGVGSALQGLLVLVCGQVKAGGIVVVRTHKSSQLSAEYGDLDVCDRRQWGINAVTIFQKRGNGR